MSSLITDQQLRNLYREAGQPTDLFPVFDRTRGFRPWIVVFAIIPTLYSLQRATISETDAEWMLRANDLLSASDLDGIVSPGGSDSRADIKYQPPMGTWLSALAARAVPGSRVLDTLLPSWLGTALLIASGYWFCRDLFGERVALWFVVLVAGQAVVLRQAQAAAPHALGLAFALLSLKTYARHLARETTVVGWQILSGGLCLGMCQLLSGPLIILVMFAQAACLAVEHWNRSVLRQRAIPMSHEPRPRHLLALLLLWTTALAASGWWPLMMSSAYGLEFWSAWLHGPASAAGGSPVRSLVWDLLADIRPLAGVAAVGMVLAVRAGFRGRRLSELLLIATAAIATCGWLIAMAFCDNPDMLPAACRALLIVCLIAFAARAVDDVSRGSLRILTVALATLLPLVLSYGRSLFSADELLPLVFSSTGLLIVIFLLFLTVGFLNRNEFSPHARPRVYSGVFLALLVFANFRTGLADLEGARFPSRASLHEGVLPADELDRLRHALARIPAPPRTLILVTRRGETARLRLELATTYPRAQLYTAVDEWGLGEQLDALDSRDSVVVLWWESLPGTRVSSIPGWIRQTLGNVPRFDGLDLQLYRLVYVGIVAPAP